MSDTHGARDNQQIWSRARTKLAESLQTIYDKIELLPNKTGRPQAALELGVDEQIGSLEHVIPIFAKFKEDVPSKNITELWPIFIKSWNKLKESRPQWTDPGFDLRFHAIQLAGAVARIRGYAHGLPHNQYRATAFRPCRQNAGGSLQYRAACG